MRRLNDIHTIETLPSEDIVDRPEQLFDVDRETQPVSSGVSNRPKVLMYHRIVDRKSIAHQEENCLHVEEFKRQLELIDRLHYTPITFEDYLLYQEGKLQLPQKPVILTFDDGYLDTYRLAYPLLEEYGMKAVVFVLGDRSIQMNSWDFGVDGISKARLMSDHHIVELYENGFEIGSHTLSHPKFQYLPDADKFQEIHKPKIVLEALLGAPVNSFSYPYGLVDSEIKKLVYRAGYRFACSVYSGPALFGIDPLEIRRITIHNNITSIGFATRLMAPFELLEWMWWKSGNGHTDTITAN